MTRSSKKPAAAKPDPASRTLPRVKQRSATDAGFDRYLHRQMHALYDPVLKESIPDELAELIARFDARPGKGPAEG